ncbi:MAG TPA: hypothetical protein PKN27_10950 [Propionibacteriaceae bacterium]|nr:hypothetical protein [Propionibacteriaceae bacterium]
MSLYRVTYAGPQGHRPRSFRGLGEFYPGVPREIELDDAGAEALRAKGLTVKVIKADKTAKEE